MYVIAVLLNQAQVPGFIEITLMRMSVGVRECVCVCACVCVCKYIFIIINNRGMYHSCHYGNKNVT